MSEKEDIKKAERGERGVNEKDVKNKKKNSVRSDARHPPI